MRVLVTGGAGFTASVPFEEGVAAFGRAPLRA